MIDKQIWIDSPDINGDGFSEIPTTIGPSIHRIYSSQSINLPVIFEAELKDGPNTKWPFDDIESGELLLQYYDDRTPGLRMAVIPSKRIKKAGQNYVRSVFDIRTPPREIASYEWDTHKNAFVGPKNGPNNLWAVHYPIMIEDTNNSDE